MKRSFVALFFLYCLSSIAVSQHADLSGLTFCIDPGHGGKNGNDNHVIPDAGVGFYESESNFYKAFYLKALLEAKGATVLLTRYTNDYPANPDGTDNEPSLAARVKYANDNNVDWFHSIHSNAAGGTNTSTNYTLMLVREKRSLTDRYASSGNGLGVTEDPRSDTVAKFIGPLIKARNRTTSWTFYRDWTFYGGTIGGFSLGVLRGLAMPGELSEGSFHDFYPETRRLMNNQYRKMEAYAIRDAFLQYYGVPSDNLCIVAGIQTDLATGLPMNNTVVRILPEDIVYHGDNFNNGYFFFDSLQAGPHTVRFEITGFDIDSVQINVSAGQTVFVDRTLESTLPPRLLSSTPAQNATGIMPNTSIQLNFSKRVIRSSAESSIYLLDPSGARVAGTFTWFGNDVGCTFTPGVRLQMDTTYQFVIGTQVKDLHNVLFDGNADGIAGDSLIITFRTRFADVVPPLITAYYPRTDTVPPASNSIMNITFNEPLNVSTVSMSNLAAGQIGGMTIMPRSLYYWRYGNKSGVNMVLTDGMLPGSTYRARVSGVTDSAGNALQSVLVWQFAISPQTFQPTALDGFDSSVVHWDQPAASSSTTGVDAASFNGSTLNVPTASGVAGSGELTYAWTNGGSQWLIDERLTSGPARSVTWEKKGTRLQAYVFGVGDSSLFRFVVEDSVDAFPAGRPENREVSSWKRVDWVGWRLLEWDFEKDSAGMWLGNGKLEGAIRFYGFQLSYVPGESSLSGKIGIDQLQLVTEVITRVDETTQSNPLSFNLHQNYPNPFNPSTIIRYQIPRESRVRLTVYNLIGQTVQVLVDENKSAGYYSCTFDASGLPSGVYFYALDASGFHDVHKMLLVR